MPTRTLSRRASRTVEPEDEYDEDTRTTDDDDAEPPRRGRRGRARTEEPEEEAPRRARSSRSSNDEDEPRSSRRGQEERPSRPSTGKGWKSFKQKKEASSDWVKNFTLPEEATLIKILDEEPFSVYSEHWIDELSGKKSFVCLEKDCPLCDIGEKARVYAMFNILDLTDPEDPKVKPWKVSSTVAEILENYAMDPKTSPINRVDLYWSVFKSGGGKKGKVQTNLNPVKARDVEEDWDCVPFTEDELEDFTLLNEDDVLTFSSKKALREIADDLA